MSSQSAMENATANLLLTANEILSISNASQSGSMP